jgi:hypothetical protein
VTLPFFGPVILTPQSTTTTVTITGQFTEPAFALLPVRTRTFVGGTPAGLQVTAAALQARSHASLPGDGAPFLPEVKDATSTFAPRQSVSAPLDVSHQAGGWSYRAIANSEAARSVSVTADEATVVGSGKKSADLTATGGTGFIPAVFARAAAAPADTICFRLPRRYTATYNLTSNGPRRRNSTSSGDLVSLNFGAETSVGAPGPGTTSGTVILEAGDRCMTLEVDLWQCSITNGVTVGCDLPRSLEWSYTVALRPAP